MALQKNSSSFKSREEELKKYIRYRDRIIGLLFLCLLVAIAGLVRAPHVIDVHQPPDPRYGHISKPGDVSTLVAYTFAKDIFMTLQQWDSNGEKDYEKNRFDLRAFITPQYHQQIKNSIAERFDNNELQGRTRIVTMAPGAAFSEQVVKIHGSDSWTVYLDLRVREFIDLRQVKEAYVRYPIRVVRHTISREFNPWQLALDGFSDTPEDLIFNDGKQ
ncbi:MAG: TIGR03746 family integrating conjugative element protein [Gammaproteobacteria bacterium]|nr:TIGR03746 family integrating conjugative element protein [Gammaproteobacteria bacterium]